MSTDRTDPVARTRELLAWDTPADVWGLTGRLHHSRTLLAELADACEAKDAEIERLRDLLEAVIYERDKAAHLHRPDQYPGPHSRSRSRRPLRHRR